MANSEYKIVMRGDKLGAAIFFIWLLAMLLLVGFALFQTGCSADAVPEITLADGDTENRPMWAGDQDSTEYGADSETSDIAACIVDSDCETGMQCTQGRCETETANCDVITDIIVGETPSMIKTGEQRKLFAQAINSEGKTLDSVSFLWESLNPDIVSVDDEPGMIHGGLISGTTTVVASPSIEGTDCRGTGLTATFLLQNFAPYQDGLRIVVVDRNSFETIGGVTVIVNGETSTTPHEGNRGVLILEDIESPYNIHAFHEGYHYLSLIDVESSDLLLPLRNFDGINRQAGVRSRIDYSAVPGVLQQDLRFGFFGLSFKGDVLDFGPMTIFSRPVLSEMPISGPFHDEIALPVNVQFQTTDSSAEIELLAEGESKSDMAWAIGGYVSTEELVELITERLYSGWVDVGAFILSLLSFSGSYYHGIVPDLNVEPSPMVPDNGEGVKYPRNIADLNGNGDTMDLVPDYDSFSNIDSAVLLETPLDNRLKVYAGTFPSLVTNLMDGMFVIIGAKNSDGQMVPVGFGAKAVELEEFIDKPSIGKGGELWLNYSTESGGFLNRYVVMAFAVPVTQMFSSGDSSPYSAIIKRFEDAPSNSDLGDFPALVPWGHVFSDKRKVRFIAAEDADMHRLRFSRNGRDWDIYSGKMHSDFDYIDIEIPKPPYDDPFGSMVRISALHLAFPVGFESLVEFFYSNRYLSSLDSVLRSYSVFTVEPETE